MKTLLSLTLCVLVALTVAVVESARVFDRRLAAIEQRLQGPADRTGSTAPAKGEPAQPAGRKSGIPPGAWRASNGVVLSADDVARLELEGKQTDKWAAELEYSLRGRKSSRRAPQGTDTSDQLATKTAQPQR